MSTLVSDIHRYLGISGTPDEETKAIIEVKRRLLSGKASGRHCHALFEIQANDGNRVILKKPRLTLEGKAIARHLTGSTHVALMAATLGQPADQMILADSYRSPSDALITDAVASAMVEDVCDECEDAIRATLGPADKMTSRFSPGYSDLPLSVHPEIIRVLDATKRIGLTANDSHLLLPLKSVIAIIGIGTQATEETPGSGCHGKQCDQCPLSSQCTHKKERR